MSFADGSDENDDKALVDGHANKRMRVEREYGAEGWTYTDIPEWDATPAQPLVPSEAFGFDGYTAPDYDYRMSPDFLSQ